MPDRPTSNPKQFIQGAPVLHVPDVQGTARYYRDVLGFVFDFGDDNYAVVWRDNSAVHLVKDESTPSGVHLFQWVRDVDSYYDEIIDRDADVTSRPVSRPYGIREFSVRDINGIEIVFGQEIDD